MVFTSTVSGLLSATSRPISLHPTYRVNIYSGRCKCCSRQCGSSERILTNCEACYQKLD